MGGDLTVLGLKVGANADGEGGVKDSLPALV